MITKCPACGTLFLVTPEQLQVHQGQVRCGRCMTVFDGLVALAALPEPAPEAAARSGSEVGGFKLEPVEPAKATAAPQPPAARAAETVGGEQDYGPVPEQLSLDEKLFPDSSQARHALLSAAGAALPLFLLGGQAA